MTKKQKAMQFLTTEPFMEMLQTYHKLKPLSTSPEEVFRAQLEKYDFAEVYPMLDNYLTTHSLSSPESVQAAAARGDKDAVALASSLSTLFETTLKERLSTAYDVLGNSPATYFICGVWANMKRGREFHPASHGITVTYSDVDAYGNRNVKYRNRDYEMTLIFHAVEQYTKTLSWTAHRLLVYTLMRGNQENWRNNSAAFHITEYMDWAGLKSRDAAYRQLKNDVKSLTNVQITAESFKEYFESFYTTHLATEAEITRYTGEIRITFSKKVRQFLTQYYQLIPDWMGRLSENTYRMAFYLFYRARKAPTAKTGAFTLNIADVVHYIGLPSKEEVKNRNYDAAIIRPFNKAIEEIEAVSGGAIRMSFPYDNITDFLAGQMAVQIDETMTQYIQKLEPPKRETRRASPRKRTPKSKDQSPPKE